MSTFHTTKNFEPLREKYNDLKEIKPLGEYLFEKYGQETYSICFVNYSGKRRDLHNYNITQTPIAPKGSIEKTLHDTKARLAFVNISDTILFPYEFRNKSLSPIYDGWYSTDWSKVYDGIFFIDEMTPADIKLLNQRIGLKQPYQLPKEYYKN